MNQIKAGAVLSYVTIAVHIIVGIAYMPFLLRMLGQSEYGIYSLAMSVIAYLTILDLGFANAIIRYTAKFRAEGKVEEQYQMFGMFFKLYSIIGFVALFLGILLLLNVDALFDKAMTTDEQNKIRVMLLLMSFNLAFTFPLSIFSSIISAYEKFIFHKLVNICRTVLNPLIMIGFLLMGYKAIALVIVATLFNLGTLLVYCWYCFKHLQIKIKFGRFNWSFLKEVSLYSFWVFLNAIMDRIYWSTGQFILGVYRGAEAVAVYGVAIHLKQMFFMFSTAISGVFLPRITAMITSGASEKVISDLFIKTGRIQFIVMSFILSGFIIFGRVFINLWAGEGYDEAYIITLLLFVPAIIPLIQNVGISILLARNQLKFRSLLYLGISVLSIFIAIPLAQKYGGIGCAIATSLALLIGNGIIINIYYYKKIALNIPAFWGEILKMSIAPVALTIFAIYVLKLFDISSLSWFLITGTAYSLLYILLFWFLSMNKYERNLIAVPVLKVIKRFS